MKPINIYNSSKIEDLYKKLEKSSFINFPTDIKFQHFNYDWELIQFICTWRKKQENAEIILKENLEVDSFDKYTILNLIGFCLVDKIIHKQTDIKKDILSRFKDFVKHMNSVSFKEYKDSEFVKGQRYDFIFLGGYKNEYLKFFYKNKEEFKSQIEIKNFLNNFKFNDDIKTIIYELLSNTDKHGRWDIQEKKIENSIRGITINRQNFLAKGAKEAFLQKFPQYKGFLTAKEYHSICIFDNGEGIAKKILGESPQNYEETIEAIEKAFKEFTTSSNIPNSGMGLHFVRESVEALRASLYIRTGNVELNHIPSSNNLYPRFRFKDLRFSVIGTLVKILIPVKDNE